MSLQSYCKIFFRVFFMAENKKSFILYTDQSGVFNQLPDEIAGKLIKHIFAYVNDENPISDDLIINIAFEPIKQSLKRDLKRYEQYVEKQAVNGAKGGRPKKPTETQITQPFFEKPKKADSVSVSDSVSVNDNKININIFDELYNLYNKKVNRTASLKVFNKIKITEYDAIRKHIPNFVKTFKDKQFQPYFSTYLHNERWHDEITIIDEIPNRPKLATLNDE
ncbi:hypothetical protein UFOVP528_29 [uncultured Caudovirales phage]|uniref:DUF6291 domain-containing protein n=1 Tax=uncultured Caudovirales phage TaxID=2100421 RepID=A0A6J5MQ07_9CAUD|nr:hypothetical protein UFOVP528_29 [uncultured Caudovirales phage]